MLPIRIHTKIWLWVCFLQTVHLFIFFFPFWNDNPQYCSMCVPPSSFNGMSQFSHFSTIVRRIGPLSFITAKKYILLHKNKMGCLKVVFNIVLQAKFTDIQCINRYFGWYQDSGHTEVIQLQVGETIFCWIFKIGCFWGRVALVGQKWCLDFWHCFFQLKDDLDSWYEVLKKPLIITEYGADTIPGLHTVRLLFFIEILWDMVSRHLQMMNPSEIWDPFMCVDLFRCLHLCFPRIIKQSLCISTTKHSTFWERIIWWERWFGTLQILWLLSVSFRSWFSFVVLKLILKAWCERKVSIDVIKLCSSSMWYFGGRDRTIVNNCISSYFSNHESCGKQKGRSDQTAPAKNVGASATGQVLDHDQSNAAECSQLRRLVFPVFQIRKAAAKVCRYLSSWCKHGCPVSRLLFSDLPLYFPAQKSKDCIVFYAFCSVRVFEGLLQNALF